MVEKARGIEERELGETRRDVKRVLKDMLEGKGGEDGLKELKGRREGKLSSTFSSFLLPLV